MRELRQDEIELIERFRKRNPPLDSIPEEVPNEYEPLTVDEWRRGNREPSRTIPIPVGDFPQEDTIKQIKRMVDSLPEDDTCESYGHPCVFLKMLMISKWAREFLKQMIRNEEGRPRC